MKKLLVPVASVAAGALVIGATLCTGTVGALWADAAPLDLGSIDLTAMVPDDMSSFDVRAMLSATRTLVPGRGTVPDVFPVLFEYRAGVVNLGPDEAKDITVAVSLPIVAGLDVVGVAPDPALECDGSQTAVPQVDTPDHGLLLCTATGPLAAGSSVE
ncbi:MAG: hypothetical protein FWD11_09590, partial [Micrococcales bacterium]|nr:hypothetical protein [Micrococcales bacterium]